MSEGRGWRFTVDDVSGEIEDEFQDEDFPLSPRIYTIVIVLSVVGFIAGGIAIGDGVTPIPPVIVFTIGLGVMVFERMWGVSIAPNPADYERRITYTEKVEAAPKYTVITSVVYHIFVSAGFGLWGNTQYVIDAIPSNETLELILYIGLYGVIGVIFLQSLKFTHNVLVAFNKSRGGSNDGD